MASSSSSPSAPAFSSQSWNYDVFLSFRGEDTRQTFVDHLYAALEQQGIYTYKDDVTLPRGESIAPALKKAIGESQIAVIIFSKNYADSSWCLDELAHIMECRDTRGQIVLPIFYDVDPSEVRKQKRNYEEAFFKHVRENTTKVESWRKALADASNISGWETRNIANGLEAGGIKQIVFEISQKLQPLNSSESENLVGIALRMKRLKSELEIGTSDVRMIGVWGVGGGGKTTLASSLYDDIYRQFDGCCFVQNIREESSRHGLGKLEEDILSKIGVNRVGGGRHLINTRFRHRKVLIVLDDVDHLDQLKTLAGSHSWFGPGSRIIITTRDVHVLNAHGVDVMHNISLLNKDEAITLFRQHSPQGKRPMRDYELLSEKVVSYAGGLPLALTVLGRFLCDKNVKDWMSALARLKEIPNDDIVGKLKISFDGLAKDEKDLFLDIACFYRLMRTNVAMEKLDACGFHTVIGIKVLVQKALITVSEGGYLDMHDLVEEMAHYIVRGEHPNNPEKHTRVWKVEDVLKICVMDATTELDMIEAISFNCRRADPLHHLPQIVAKMKNLRSIDWLGDPLPTNFSPTKLCYLRLAGCSLKQLWEGYKLLPNLKMMELHRLDSLTRTPEFEGLPNLEKFRLEYCYSLEEIHPSIVRLGRLVFLSIERCPSLEEFPPITALKKLETLYIFRCDQLFKLSEIHQPKMDDIGYHDSDNSVDEVASDIESSTPNFLVTWLTCCCSNLRGLESLEEPSSPHNNMNYLRLQFFLNDLRDLNLSDCRLGDEEMGSAVWDLPNLNTLNLSRNILSRLNFSRLRVPRLKRLDVSWCYALVELSNLPSSIAVVLADYCSSLESFGDISNCKWLWHVSLKDYKKNKVVGDILLDPMLQGNASEDYFINSILTHQIPKRFVGRLFRGRTFTLRLPDDWYNDFSGFLICVVTNMDEPDVDIIIMKREVDEDSLFEVCQDSNEAVDPQYEGTKTCVGYVPFGSLRHTAFSNSSYTSISVERKGEDYENYIGVELVPRKSKDHQPQTPNFATDSSEFWDDGTFTIQDHSKSSIKIKWQVFHRVVTPS